MAKDVVMDVTVKDSDLEIDVSVENQVVTEVIEVPVDKKKYGVTIDNLLGNVDENGVLSVPAVKTVVNGAGIKEINSYAFGYKFYYSQAEIEADFSSVTYIASYGLERTFAYSNLKTINLDSIEIVDIYGLREACYYCKRLTDIIQFPKLKTIAGNGLTNAFYGCDAMQGIVDFSSLETVGYNGLDGAFQYCYGITGYDFSSLKTIIDRSCNSAFRSNLALTTISFPSLISVRANSFGTASYNYAFNGCTALTEIHFRADMQATIEAMTGYSDKWGATNATIYFDL